MSSTQRGSPDEIDKATLQRGYQPTDVRPRFVVYALLGLFGGIIISLMVVAGLLSAYDRLRDPFMANALEQAPIEPAGPRLEISPEGDRAEVEARAAQQITGYGWSDREAKQARIPIERAMQITAERGWPAAADSAPEGTP